MHLSVPSLWARRVFVWAFVVFAAGCGPSAAPETTFNVLYNPCQAVVVTVDDHASAGQRRTVDEAVTMWNEAGPIKLARHGHPDAPHLPVDFQTGAGFVHGYYDDQTGRITINAAMVEGRARAIAAAHELGHAFGLGHVARPQRRSLMNKGNIDTGLTAGDMQAALDGWPACSTGR